MTKVLVTYASKYRATAEIAEVIGEALHEFGLAVDIKPVNLVENITPYETVILGSAVYAGNWLSEAADFLKNNADLLAARDVWLFSSGPVGEGDPKELLKGWEYPAALAKYIEQINPHEVVVFHGRLDMDTLNFGERLIIRMMKPPTGDFRDWEMIGDWARHIVNTLQHKQESSE